MSAAIIVGEYDIPQDIDIAALMRAYPPAYFELRVGGTVVFSGKPTANSLQRARDDCNKINGT